MFVSPRRRPATTLLLAALITHPLGCDDAPAPAAPPAATGPDQSVAEELGLLLHMDVDPIEESTEDTPAGDETTYTFDVAQGPMCLRGDPFRMGVRDLGSEDLVIFLQGGGACWSDFCFAVTKAPPGVFASGVLDPEDPINPTRDWNVVYLPYCDGSFFSGDIDHDDDGDGEPDRFHRGLQNLSAALVVARQRFPSPRRVLFAGSSGGAYGTLLGPAIARHVYPDAQLFVMADSGHGIARAGDQAFLDGMLDEFNVRRFLPADCPECMDDGHLTGIVSWFLDRAPEVRFAAFSSWHDSVLGNTFLRVPAADYAAALRVQTDRVAAAHPDRYRRFIMDGIRHTTLLNNPAGIIGTDLRALEVPEGGLTKLFSGELDIGDLVTSEIDGVRMHTWLQAMLDSDDDVWRDLQQPAGEPPY